MDLVGSTNQSSRAFRDDVVAPGGVNKITNSESQEKKYSLVHKKCLQCFHIHSECFYPRGASPFPANGAQTSSNQLGQSDNILACHL